MNRFITCSNETIFAETGKIILKELPQLGSIEVLNDSLLEEGAPVEPGRLYWFQTL